MATTVSGSSTVITDEKSLIATLNKDNELTYAGSASGQYIFSTNDEKLIDANNKINLNLIGTIYSLASGLKILKDSTNELVTIGPSTLSIGTRYRFPAGENSMETVYYIGQATSES